MFYLRYNELRLLAADPEAFDARTLVSDRRDEREQQAFVRPPHWIGTATEEALAFPYWSLWGFPEKFHRAPPEKVDEVHGLGASPGVAEGVARSVASLDEFDQVQEGEILVCQMTNPAWVVLFTKIARARHGRRRRGGASRRRRARVRDPGRRRDVGGDRADQER